MFMFYENLLTETVVFSLSVSVYQLVVYILIEIWLVDCIKFNQLEFTCLFTRSMEKRYDFFSRPNVHSIFFVLHKNGKLHNILVHFVPWLTDSSLYPCWELCGYFFVLCFRKMRIISRNFLCIELKKPRNGFSTQFQFQFRMWSNHLLYSHFKRWFNL